MKFTLTFKTPDVLYYAKRAEHPDHHKEMEECADKFLMYGEVMTVELDTETGTAAS